MIDKDTELLEEAYEDVVVEEGMRETLASIQGFGDKISNLPEFVNQSVGWLGKMALGGLAGAAITAGLGKLLEITASRLDRKRVKTGDKEQSAVAGVSDSEFAKQRDSYEQETQEDMPLDQQVQLRIKIAEELQKRYPVRDKSFWVKSLEVAAEGVQSKVGIGIGAALGVIASKLAIPFPTL